MTAKTWYVELEKKISYGSEVVAATEEEAQDQVIKQAGGNPRDWEIIESHEVERFSTERGAAEIL